MPENNAVFLIDFDNVLFDTEKLKLEIERNFIKLSNNYLSAKILWQEYKDTKEKYGFNNLPQLCISLSQKHSAISNTDINSIFYNANFKKHAIKDSHYLIKGLQKLGKVFVYSLGHTDYQQLKIRKSGFEKLIGKNNIIIVQDKINGLEKILTGFKTNQVYVIDDRSEVLEKSFKINNSVVNIWHRYGMYKGIWPKVNGSVAFQTNNLREIINFVEEYIGKININNNVFSVIKPTAINSKHITRIVKFSKHDTLIKKFTHDSKRFKDKYSFNRWYKKGRILYLLINQKNNLLGIIWFGNSSNNFITAFKKTPDFKSGDELNADMSSSFRGNPAPQSGEDVIDKKLPYLTFAIRIYKPARELGLSEKFFNMAHNDLLNTLKLSKSKYNGLWLSVNCKNQIAIHLYKKLGFKEFKKTDSELIMTLEN